MHLQNLSDIDLVESTKKVVRTERKIIHWVLAHLMEIEKRRLHAKAGYDGMYTYMTRELGYSGAAATLRIKAMRLMQSSDEVADKVQAGTVCLSQLAQVQTSLLQARSAGRQTSPTRAAELLSQVEGKSTFETKSILAKELDLPCIDNENIKPQKDDSVRLEITLTAEQYADLEAAKSSLSHVCHQGSWAEVIAVLAKRHNQAKAGSSHRKKSDAKLTRFTTASVVKGVAKVQGPQIKRGFISINIKRALNRRAGGCCEFISTRGQRCTSKYQLQIDHVQPLALGGNDDFKNLRLLCRTHNNLEARELGLGVR